MRSPAEGCSRWTARWAAAADPHPHRHLAEDELFYISSGSITFTAGEVTREVGPGESAFVPRGMAHSYVNDSGSVAHMLAVYTPSGMEGWFREACTPVTDPTLPAPPPTPELIERMLEAGPRHNVEWLLPG